MIVRYTCIVDSSMFQGAGFPDMSYFIRMCVTLNRAAGGVADYSSRVATACVQELTYYCVAWCLLCNHESNRYVGYEIVLLPRKENILCVSNSILTYSFAVSFILLLVVPTDRGLLYLIFLYEQNGRSVGDYR